jgi:ATP-dependent exoDNAse (exonuclease V) beta subunit
LRKIDSRSWLRPKFERGKTFEHDFLHFEDFEAKIIDGKRYYFAPDGNAYPSVTTVLGAKKDKKHLEAWIERVGVEKAEQIKVQAGHRGTAIHTIAEKYMLNEEQYPEDVMPANIMTFKCIKPVLDKHIGKVYAIEAPLYSAELHCAGRTDCIAEFDGVISIVDFKTSLKVKREEWITDYFLQATCYGHMAERLTNIQIPQIAIIIAVDGQPEPQVFVKKRYDYVDQMKTVFDGAVR